MRALLAIGTVLALGGVAAAQPDYDYPYDEKPRERSPQDDLDLEVSVGFLGGMYGVGGVLDSTDGVAINLGWRHGRLLAYGEYDGLGTGGDDLAEGFIHRVGGNVRVDLDYFGKDVNESFWGGGILWAEAGVGWEHFGWETGPRTDRGDLSFGLGAQYTLRFGGRKPKLVGIYYAAKILVARAPEATRVAALCVEGCGGRDLASRDLGVFFSGALTFGR